jgi:hypothetical protein
MVLVNAANIKASVLSDSVKPLTKVNKEFLIVVNIVRDVNGNSDVNTADIQTTLNQVNTVYSPIGVSFTVCQFNYIDNFQYDSLVLNTIINGKKLELDPQYRLQHRINMYFISEPDLKPNETSPLTPPITCGYAALGGIAEYGSIVIRKTCIDVITIAHELGHFFGLSHPFDNTIPELANESNCSTAGDKICDTPADPYTTGNNINMYIDLNCNFIYAGQDANHESYAPDVSNIMSYYTPCVCLTFTHDQYESMATYYLSHLGTW